MKNYLSHNVIIYSRAAVQKKEDISTVYLLHSNITAFGNYIIIFNQLIVLLLKCDGILRYFFSSI